MVPLHAAQVMPLTLKKHLMRGAEAAEEEAEAPARTVEAASGELSSCTAAISTLTLPPSLSERSAVRASIVHRVV